MISNHAAVRMNQRGINKSVVALIQDQGDREVFVGNGCRVVFLSHDRIAQLKMEGFANRTVERAAGVSVVENAQTDVVTVLRPAKRKGRHYSRG